MSCYLASSRWKDGEVLSKAGQYYTNQNKSPDLEFLVEVQSVRPETLRRLKAAMQMISWLIRSVEPVSVTSHWFMHLKVLASVERKVRRARAPSLILSVLNSVVCVHFGTMCLWCRGPPSTTRVVRPIAPYGQVVAGDGRWD
jgi:hypothetical protein